MCREMRSERSWRRWQLTCGLSIGSGAWPPQADEAAGVAVHERADVATAVPVPVLVAMNVSMRLIQNGLQSQLRERTLRLTHRTHALPASELVVAHTLRGSLDSVRTNLRSGNEHPGNAPAPGRRPPSWRART